MPATAPRTALAAAILASGSAAFAAAPWAQPFTCAPPSTDWGVTMYAAQRFDKLGMAVAGIGDFNGDGVDDFAVGAPGESGNGTRPGEVFVVFGSDSIPATLQRADLDGTRGFVARGVANSELCGSSIAGADVNGDGRSDLVVSAPVAAVGAFNAAGVVYVLFGRASGIPAVVELSTLLPANGGNGSQGFVLQGAHASMNFGFSLAANDINGDGRGDILVGAPGGAGPGGARFCGEAYVVFGRAASNFPAVIGAASIPSSQGSVLYGAEFFDGFGRYVASAGDFNGDSFGDVAVLSFATAGQGNATPGAGEVTIVYGKQDFPSTFDTLNLSAANGHIVYGQTSNPARPLNQATRIGAAGDVDNDGFDDLILGNTQPGWSGVTLYYGAANPGASILTGGIPTTRGAHFAEPFEADSGGGCDATGDIDGDGFADLLVGGPSADSLSGQTSLIFGKSARFSGNQSLALSDGDNGTLFLPGAVVGTFGNDVRAVGDVNDDGIADFLVGAANGNAIDNSNSAWGRAYLIYGRPRQQQPAGTAEAWSVR